MSKREYWLLSISIILITCLLSPTRATPAATTATKWPEQIYVGSYPKISLAYAGTLSLAQLITKYTPSRGIIKELSGSTPGLTALGRGTVDTYASGQWDLVAAYFGKAGSPWQGKPLNIRLLNYFYPMATNGIGVRPGEGINKIEDLVGKRVLTDSRNYGWGQIAHDLIWDYYKIKDKIIRLEITSFEQVRDAMIQKEVDAFIYGVEGPYLLEVKKAVGVKWLDQPPEVADYVANNMEGFVRYQWPPHLLKYWDLPLDTKIYCAASCNSTAVRTDFPEHVVYGMLDALYGGNHLDEVRSMAPFMSEVSLKRAPSRFWLPFHDGAVKYYKDRGVWTDEMEKRQKEILAKPRGR